MAITLDVISYDGDGQDGGAAFWANASVPVNMQPRDVTLSGLAATNGRRISAAAFTVLEESTVAAMVSALGAVPTPTFTDDVTASTTQTQGQSPLTSDRNVIATCANDNDAVTLPAASLGRPCWIRNASAHIAQIFPATSGIINGGSVNASVTLAAGAAVRFEPASATEWWSF